ncbi:hypothetical protein DAY19_04755 [Halobacteriovorax vibrionivorans]|uniref:GP-PDE domain-containing protein n=1 Tax=Halobacteriovorax vibrionivorans TaxID=2152716 RepID=A0ABY0IJD8_9BACT|nr:MULTISPECIES: glycerophosphodiester phosphodiesterase family protein [Halobacteriovorax]RZF23084.1 hypothetical protein DAY19_04755 [Halobacteriovorax vibrionivorans]TGD49284.1 hypothetical protein EP118_00325 [Halobacteriovorax sp. Y22]
MYILRPLLILILTFTSSAIELGELDLKLIQSTSKGDNVLVQKKLTSEQIRELSSKYERRFLKSANTQELFTVIKDIKTKRTFNISLNYNIYQAKLIADHSPLLIKIKNAIKEFWYKIIKKDFIPELTGIFKLEIIKRFEPPHKDAFTDTSRFIAHAGGVIDGRIYTNSLEAINSSYKKGFRRIELDLQETSDGIIVAVHEWDDWADETNFSGDLPPTHQDFMNHKLFNKYTPLDLSTIRNWFKEHPDAVLVTDKINKPKKVLEVFKYKDRLVMELFNESSLNEALKLNIKEAMPTHYLYLNIKNKLDEYFRKGITSIALSRYYAKNNYDDLLKLRKQGFKVYAYHLNHGKDKRDERFVACNELGLFHGFYADNWNFKEEVECFNPL